MRNRNPNVLVVDDEPAVRTLMADVLRMKGYQPRTARHGMEALELCGREEGPPDLLITDVVMPPYFNGIELVRRLRHFNPAMKALYVSAYAADPQVAEAFGDPLSDFLPKPLSPIVLAQTVERMLDDTPEAADRDARRKSGTVLLLIADPVRRHHLKECLLGSGIWVLEAMHPSEAQFIGRWNEGPIHLLLVDAVHSESRPGWLKRLQSSRPDMQTAFFEENGGRINLITPEELEGEPAEFWLGLRKLLEATLLRPDTIDGAVSAS